MIDYRDWYSNQDTVTVYPETDPLVAHSQFNTLTTWVAVLWVAVGVAVAVLLTLLLSRWSSRE